MKNHFFWMIIGCTVPLLLIFLLPLFGITGNYTILIFIVAMFAKQKMTAEQQKLMNEGTYTKPEN